MSLRNSDGNGPEEILKDNLKDELRCINNLVRILQAVTVSGSSNIATGLICFVDDCDNFV